MVLGKVYENCTKIKEKCYFKKLTFNRVISTGNLLFEPQDRIITKFGQKKNGLISFWAKCIKTDRKLRKRVILRNLLRIELYQPETTYLVPT